MFCRGLQQSVSQSKPTELLTFSYYVADDRNGMVDEAKTRKSKVFLEESIKASLGSGSGESGGLQGTLAGSPEVLRSKIIRVILRRSAEMRPERESALGGVGVVIAIVVSVLAALVLLSVIILQVAKMAFLDAAKHLFERVCPSVRPSVRP